MRGEENEAFGEVPGAETCAREGSWAGVIVSEMVWSAGREVERKLRAVGVETAGYPCAGYLIVVKWVVDLILSH